MSGARESSLVEKRAIKVVVFVVAVALFLVTDFRQLPQLGDSLPECIALYRDFVQVFPCIKSAIVAVIKESWTA